MDQPASLALVVPSLSTRPPTYTRLLEGEINLGQLLIWLKPNGSNEEQNTSMNKATFWDQF